MSTVQNRAQLRDTIRRSYLGITPPVDTGTGFPGDVPSSQPDPSNPTLNQAIESACSEINRAAGFLSVVQWPIPLPATSSTYLGPQWIDLNTVPGLSVGQVNEIRRVVWDDGSGNPQLLTPVTWQDQDRQMFQIDNQPASVPLNYFAEGYRLAILPATTAAGSIVVYAGTSALSPLSDADYITGIPADYHVIVCIVAACIVLENKMMDAEAMSRLQLLTPRRQDGIRQIMSWRKDTSKQSQYTIGVLTNRGTAGLRRIIR